MGENEDLVNAILEQLRAQGIDLESLACGDEGSEGGSLKVICVPATLRGSLSSLTESSRDHVVMARVDSETIESLDAWIETGALRSRSEAAALFLKEGLSIRDGELAELRGALNDLATAKKRLKERAERVLGSTPVDA